MSTLLVPAVSTTAVVTRFWRSFASIAAAFANDFHFDFDLHAAGGLLLLLLLLVEDNRTEDGDDRTECDDDVDRIFVCLIGSAL